MPVLAVHNPATPCRCLRLGAAGWRRACGGGKAIKRTAEQCGRRELRATAAPLAHLLRLRQLGGWPTGTLLSGHWRCPSPSCPLCHDITCASDLFHCRCCLLHSGRLPTCCSCS